MKRKSIIRSALAVSAVGCVSFANADVVTNKNWDIFGQSAFTRANCWQSNEAPSPAHDYLFRYAGGVDFCMRTPITTNDYVTSVWPGGALTLGTDTTPGWLSVEAACVNKGGTTAKSGWYDLAKFGNFTIHNGGIVFPYGNYGGLVTTNYLTLASANEIEVRVGGGFPGGAQADSLTYFGAKLKGDVKQVLRFRCNEGATKSASVTLWKDNSAFKGQFVFDGVRLQDSLCESLNSERFGGDPGYFRADALYFPNGFYYTVERDEGNNNPNTGRTIPAAGNGNRGITFKGGGLIGGYLSNTWDINVPIVGDTLVVKSGITPFDHIGGLIRFNKPLTVDTVTLDKTFFSRIQFGDDITDETCCLIKLNSRSSVGCRNTCRVRVEATDGCYFEPRANSEGTSIGNVVVSPDSILTNATVKNVTVLSPGVPAYGYAKIWWPIATFPKTLVARENIVILNCYGQAIAYPSEIRDEGDNWVVYIKKDADGTSYTYVVPAGTAGNTPTAPYNSWATAANDLPTAIAATTAGSGADQKGSIVLVAPGTYDIASPIKLEKRIMVRSCDPETGLIDPEHTILDGGYPARTNRIMKLDYGSVVGFTFRHGATTATGAYDGNSPGGGAVDVKNGSEWRIRNCIFRENYAIKCSGGALGNFTSFYGAWSVTDCLFENNATLESGNGAAFGCNTTNGDQAGVGFKNCIFRNNTAAGSCAAYSGGRPMFFAQCVFSNNVGQSGYHTVDIGMTHGRVEDSLFEHPVSMTGPVAEGASTFTRCVFRNVNTTHCFVFRAGGQSQYNPLGFTDCVFTNNTAAGLCCCQNMQGEVLFKQCLARDNTFGKLVDVHTVGYQFDQCTVVSNTITGNNTWPYQLRPSWIANSIIWDNDYTAQSPRKTELYLMAAITNSVVEYTNYTSSMTNAWIRTPGFLSATDCHLRPGAFARDKSAAHDWTQTTATDLDGNPRCVNRQGVALAPDAEVDLGCYECATAPRGVLLSIQ